MSISDLNLSRWLSATNTSCFDTRTTRPISCESRVQLTSSQTDTHIILIWKHILSHFFLRIEFNYQIGGRSRRITMQIAHCPVSMLSIQKRSDMNQATPIRNINILETRHDDLLTNLDAIGQWNKHTKSMTGFRVIQHCVLSFSFSLCVCICICICICIYNNNNNNNNNVDFVG